MTKAFGDLLAWCGAYNYVVLESYQIDSEMQAVYSLPQKPFTFYCQDEYFLHCRQLDYTIAATKLRHGG